MKYIDAEKLITAIDKRLSIFEHGIAYNCWASCKKIVESLQQEQPECSGNLVDVDAVREDFMTEVYRVLDADPTNDRANAIIAAFDSLPTVSQEQTEVDLEKEIDRFWDSCIKHKNERGGNVIWSNKIEIEVLAHHFYSLRNRALEEAARNVYESWMGGTMDDVCRDMVELGRVINARKEE